MTDNFAKMLRFQSQFLVILVTISVVFLGPSVSDANLPMEITPQADLPRNVILMIGDGMGFEQMKLARWVEQGKQGMLTMDTLPHIFNVSTNNLDDLLTDSAAGGTAIASGSKTDNYRISQCNDGRNLTTILEIAQQLGKATGIITTTTINHATPATFASHEQSRNNYDSILRQLVDSSVDVLLGGGNNDMTPEILTKISSNGYSIAYDKTELMAATGKTWGIFADSHMDYESSRNLVTTPSIKEMTEKSIELLSSDENGFFMVVEGGRIDHSGHDNNVIDQALEAIAFDKAVESSLNFAKDDGNTLLIITADHETGGLAIVSDTLDKPLPETVSTEEEKRAARIDRANQISATFSTGYHTDQNIPLLAYGQIPVGFSNNTIVENTVAFSFMKEFIDPSDTIAASQACTRVLSDISYWTSGVKVGDQARYNITEFRFERIPGYQMRYAVNDTTELITIKEGDEYLDRVVSVNET
ncbi:MAG: alkaline phosphatase, partial [Candidatus Kariarchaeaceae archaeon]